jgi:hypothetical protein
MRQNGRSTVVIKRETTALRDGRAFGSCLLCWDTGYFFLVAME